jgi:hypothetical protein
LQIQLSKIKRVEGLIYFILFDSQFVSVDKPTYPFLKVETTYLIIWGKRLKHTQNLQEKVNKASIEKGFKNIS